MSADFTILIENRPGEAGTLRCEPGLSVLVEAKGKRILFDTGLSGDFLDNAEALNVPLLPLDAVVISHGHNDHLGGLPRLLPLLPAGTPIYFGKNFFVPKYSRLPMGEYRYTGGSVGREDIAAAGLRPIEVTEASVELGEGLTLWRDFPQSNDFEQVNPKFSTSVDNGASYRPDLFEDELVLSIDTPEGLVVLVGCSHIGVINIADSILRRSGRPLRALLGGTHLIDADKTRLQKTLTRFEDYRLEKLGICHCTGEAGIEAAAAAFGERFLPLQGGTRAHF